GGDDGYGEQHQERAPVEVTARRKRLAQVVVAEGRQPAPGAQRRIDTAEAVQKEEAEKDGTCRGDGGAPGHELGDEKCDRVAREHNRDQLGASLEESRHADTFVPISRSNE